MKHLVIITLLICASAITILGRDFDVSVAVQADSEEMGQMVENYLTAKLKTLNDVKLRDEGGWNIKVMVTESTAADNTPQFTISAVITSEGKCAVLNSKSQVVSSEPCDRFENFGVFSGTGTDLKDMCDELVADVNDGSLEPLR